MSNRIGVKVVSSNMMISVNNLAYIAISAIDSLIIADFQSC
jgi:hypothetical protein